MQQVLRQAQRATKLLRGLLRFVRASERHVASVNLNDVVRSALDVVSYRFGVDEITVGGRLDPHLPPVRADAIRLEQVVVNLLSNAIDVLRAVKPPRRLTVDSSVDQGDVCVAVADNGPGVAVPQPDGGGARFLLSLPSAVRHGATPKEVGAPADGGGGGGGGGSAPRQARLAGVRVLIVDDEAAIRRPMAKFLGRRGAQVYEAEDGAGALEWLQGQTPDVILVDLRMPRMSGTELFAALEAAQPELAARVLFLSGDVAQLAEPGNTPVPRERVLVKPVELADLEARVAAFLAGRAARKAP